MCVWSPHYKNVIIFSLYVYNYIPSACLGIRVNDTIIGDPLFTVPFQADHTSLCYEVHGKAAQTFNLVSDVCTSVNALYSEGSSDGINVITEIGVLAVTEGTCHTIDIKLNCSYSVDDVIPLGNTVRMDGIYIRRNANRVRISVPNCENVNLVMWVTCQTVSGQEMLRFDISRGINLRPTSHGLIGKGSR